MRQAGPPPSPNPSKKGWRVDLDGVKVRARQLREPSDEATLSGPDGGQSIKQLQEEHERFRQALEMIADGATTQVALDALGRRRTYDEVVAENQQLTGLVELYEGALQAIREGTLKAEDLPSLVDDENVTASHSDDAEHPSENG